MEQAWHDLTVARAPVKRRPTTPIPSAGLDGLQEGRKRVAIESVSPEIDAGRFPAKRTLGEKVAVEADIFADGHDALACVIRYRHQSSSTSTEVPMVPLLNDRWRAEVVVTELGTYLFTIEAWIDRFETWSRQFAKRVEAGQDVSHELEVAARLVDAAAARAGSPDGQKLSTYATQLRKGKTEATAALGSDLPVLMNGTPTAACPPPTGARSKSSSRWSGRVTGPGTRCFPGPRVSRASTGRFGTSRAGCLTSRAWDSTCSTSRPSIPSAAPLAKAPTTPRRQNP